MVLPTVVDDNVRKSPKRIFIFAHPKVGKTSLASQLPNALLIDMENGSDFIAAMKINVLQLAIQEGKSSLAVLKEISNALGERKQIYDYIVLDTTTGMQDMAEDLALVLYKRSPMGKNYTGKSVLELPNGAGYYWLRAAFEEIYSWFDPYPNKALVLLGHVKNASINKEGKELGARDIDLTGKLKQILTSSSDATGFLYREKESSTNILSFKTSETDLATGARPEHLRGQEFVISELKDGKLVSYWDKIFID